MKKKILMAVLAAALLVTVFWGRIPAASVDSGSSATHTDLEIYAAAARVKAQFALMPGCRLYSLTYAGDERSQRELDYCNSLGEGTYTDCIVLDSAFRSPIWGGGAWRANRIYHWNWTLGYRNGVWHLVNFGYA